jgi:hypothetical protein
VTNKATTSAAPVPAVIDDGAVASALEHTVSLAEAQAVIVVVT